MLIAFSLAALEVHFAAILIQAYAFYRAVGITLGSRIVRAHDVRGTRRVCAAIAAVLEAP